MCLPCSVPALGFGLVGHMQAWCYPWVLDTVFSAGKSVASVDAWYSTAPDIEEILSGTTWSMCTDLLRM